MNIEMKAGPRAFFAQGKRIEANSTFTVPLAVAIDLLEAGGATPTNRADHNTVIKAQRERVESIMRSVNKGSGFARLRVA